MESISCENGTFWKVVKMMEVSSDWGNKYLLKLSIMEVIWWKIDLYLIWSAWGVWRQTGINGMSGAGQCCDGWQEGHSSHCLVISPVLWVAWKGKLARVEPDGAGGHIKASLITPSTSCLMDPHRSQHSTQTISWHMYKHCFIYFNRSQYMWLSCLRQTVSQTVQSSSTAS